MAVARLKQILPDPTKYIEVHDLLHAETAAVLERLATRPQAPAQRDGAALQEEHEALHRQSDLLLQMLTTGVYFDKSDAHIDLWVGAINRLLQARKIPSGAFSETWMRLSHYPALLALRVAGMAALMAGREMPLIRLFTDPSWRDPFSDAEAMPAVHALHEYRVLDGEVVNSFPRWRGTKWLYPASHLLREALRDVLASLEPDPERYLLYADRYEFRVALAQHCLRGTYRATPGEFIGERQWTVDDHLKAAVDFLAHGDLELWAREMRLNGVDELRERVLEVTEELKRSRRWG